jgi:hypothetical protein
MNTAYAGRFLGHFTNRAGYCSSCEDSCLRCREGYLLDFSDSLAGIIDFPAVLPVMLDEPEEFLPKKVPDHELVIAISVHEEILLSFIDRFSFRGGIIVPIEEPWWVSPFAQNRIRTICSERGLEVSFPKPFCSFAPSEGILRDFQLQYRIGKPGVRCDVRDGRIIGTEVLCSAPCGATYYVARNMVGKEANEGLVHIIDALLSAYPCTAGTEIDREFGDSIIHRAVLIQRGILTGLKLERAAG